MAHSSAQRLISAARRLAMLFRRDLVIGFTLLAVSLAGAATADAGQLVATDGLLGGETLGTASIGDGALGETASNHPSRAPSPADPQPPLVILDWHGALLLDGRPGGSGGAGSQTNSGSSVFSPIALVGPSPQSAEASLISRLALCSRISLPDPMEGRVFRPPR